MSEANITDEGQKLTFFSVIKMIGDSPITIFTIYGLMIAFFPLYGWAMLFAVMASVFAHEGGHLYAAYKNGAPVENFSVGLPSKWRIVIGTYNGTTFQVTPYWFLGGYVDPDLRGLPYWRMCTVMLGGVTVNLVLAFGLFAGSLCLLGKTELVGHRAVVTELTAVSNARIAGVMPGDEVLRVNEVFIEDRFALARELAKHKNEIVNLQVFRDGSYLNIAVQETEGGQLGAAIGGYYHRSIKADEVLLTAARVTFDSLEQTAVRVLELSHIRSAPPSKNPNMDHVHGLVAVVDVGAKALSVGLGNFLYVVAGVNAGLFFMNLLPLPILDGGQLILFGVQIWRGKAFSEKVNGIMVKVCMIFFIALMLLSAYNDVVYRVKF